MAGTQEGWIDLSDRVAVVTGAASGIGRACARALSEAGATLVVVDRDEDGLNHTVAQIAGNGGTAHARVMDVTSETHWSSLGDWLSGEFGRLDILVNSAGVATFDRVDPAMFKTYRRAFAVNVEGSLMGMTMALDFMREAGKGAIVNLSSTASLKGNPAMASYGASKAAISHFTRSAALEASRSGHDIRVNAVLPGFTETGMAQQVYDEFDEKLGGREQTMAAFSSGRAADPQEIANFVLFLVSDRASFMSGGTYKVDRAQSA